ncbi:hypothetical protein [Synechococcus sp. R60.4]|jgi:hypothetical protein|uniref:hypothetical protein n=1 Tax=unclassified Synechococcus TaxID=2626047 RepID=UPI0039C1D868
MTSPALSPDTERRAQAVWKSLRQAIVESSGFQGWLQGQELPKEEAELDRLVHRYLEQALSHLAY